MPTNCEGEESQGSSSGNSAGRCIFGWTGMAFPNTRPLKAEIATRQPQPVPAEHSVAVRIVAEPSAAVADDDVSVRRIHVPVDDQHRCCWSLAS